AIVGQAGLVAVAIYDMVELAGAGEVVADLAAGAGEDEGAVAVVDEVRQHFGGVGPVVEEMDDGAILLMDVVIGAIAVDPHIVAVGPAGAERAGVGGGTGVVG